MKTTFDLPDDLVRRVKMRAVQRHQKLREAVTQLLEFGLQSAPPAEPPPRAPTPVRLRKHRAMTITDIEAAIASGRD